MIEQICAEINNYFVYARHVGTYRIQGGSIELPFLVPGQYFCIRGSRLNNGVYQYPALDLHDEEFDGEIWEMRVDKDFLFLAADVEDWSAKNADALNSPYQSESFGGYSYSKGSGGASASGGDSAWSWKNQFSARLKRWRKINLDLGLVPVVYH